MTAAEDLPGEIPLFPLPRVILLPRVELPLNIFEPRYLAMVRHALSTPSRLIGMIQQRPDGGDFGAGCAGRITAFTETDDGRYLITLRGVCRFKIAAEAPLDPSGFRRARADWSAYRADLTPEESSSGLCRDALMQTLRGYFDRHGLMCDKWETIKDVSCEKLVSTLSVVCPLEPEEKQALLESPAPGDRARLLESILKNSLSAPSCGTRH